VASIRETRQVGRRDGSRELPVLAQVPVQLLRFPALLVALVAIAALLAAAASSSGLFLSSAADGAVAIDLSANRHRPALTVTQFGSVTASFLAPRSRALTGAVAGLLGLGPLVVTVTGLQVEASSSGGSGVPAQVVARTGFRSHVRAVAGSGTGLWVPESLARRISLRPGDELMVAWGKADATVPVGGIYRDLPSGRLPEFWQPVATRLSSANGAALPALLGEPDAVFAALAPHAPSARLDWDFPLEVSALSLQQAQVLAAGLTAVTDGLASPNIAPGSAFRSEGQGAAPYSSTPLPELVRGATELEGSIRTTSGSVAVAGIVIAMVGMAAAGAYAVRRRRVEASLLSARGMSPVLQGLRAVVESALPAAAGGALGWGIALALVRLLGPSSLIDPAAREAAASSAIRAVAVGLLLYGLGAAFAARRELEEVTRRTSRILSRAPWEAIALVLAGASLYEILTRPAGEPSSGPDRLLLLFPMLFVGGLAGLTVRLLPRVLDRMRRRVTARRMPAYLAVRRLASAPRVALLLVAGSSVAVGVLAYAGVLSETIARTAGAKAAVLVGGDVAVPLPPGPGGPPPDRPPPGTPGPSTVVLRLPPATLVPRTPVDVLAVDARTFEAVARWNGHFGGPSLHEILAALSAPAGGRLPVLLAGGSLSRESTLRVAGQSVPVTVVRQTAAFPGMTTSGLPLVVAGRRALFAASPSLATLNGTAAELWVRGAPGTILRLLAGAGIDTSSARTASKVRAEPSLLSLSWTLGYLLALGVAAAIVVVAGLLLYLQSRQAANDLSFALGRRMGLSAGTQRRAVTLELGEILGIAFVLGTGLAVAAAALVRAKLDLLPGVPGPTIFAVPWLLLGATAAGFLLVAIAGARLVGRRARRTNVAEVLRLAT